MNGSSNLDIAKFSSPEYTRSRLLSLTPARPLDAPSSQFVSSRTSISTGLPQLDAALSPPSAPHLFSSPLAARWTQSQTPALPQSLTQSQRDDDDDDDGPPSTSARPADLPPVVEPVDVPSGGIRRGEVTEVMGPRGTGKTAFAMGVAARALIAGEKVMWIDTAGPICLARFRDILQKEIRASKNSSQHEPTTSKEQRQRSIQDAADDAVRRLVYFYVPTIAHLMALVSHPPPGFPPHDTGVIVVDNISTLFNLEFKSVLPSKRVPTAPTRRRPGPVTAMERQGKLRWKLIGSLLSSLRKLALRFDSAVLTINEMGSRFRSGRRPMLHHALSGMTWDSGVSTRIVLYFAWLPPQLRRRFAEMKRVRIAEVLKTGGNAHDVRSLKRVVPFLLLKGGVRDVPGETGLRIRLSQRSETMQKRLLKRKMVAYPTSSPIRQRVRINLGGHTEPDHGDHQAVFLHHDEHNNDPQIEEEKAQGASEEHAIHDSTTGINEDAVDMPASPGAAEVSPEDDTELLLANIEDDDEFT
ncbi:hypothetical protein VTO42DRAFT_2833 [Malbranchea cinnamomea]